MVPLWRADCRVAGSTLHPLAYPSINTGGPRERPLMVATHPALMLWPITSSNGGALGVTPEMLSRMAVAVWLVTNIDGPVAVAIAVAVVGGEAVVGVPGAAPEELLAVPPPAAELRASWSMSNPAICPGTEVTVWSP